VAVGRLSYSLFLWDFPVFYAVSQHTRSWGELPRVAVALAIVIVAAVASYRFVETAALRRKARLGRARPAPARSPDRLAPRVEEAPAPVHAPS
jgi:peptidoglycan/LPS O-acetylase OafA/YrhL